MQALPCASSSGALLPISSAAKVMPTAVTRIVVGVSNMDGCLVPYFLYQIVGSRQRFPDRKKCQKSCFRCQFGKVRPRDEGRSFLS